MTEYIQTDLDWLDGAEIVRVMPGEVGLALWLKLPESILIDGRVVEAVKFEVWRDEEGNGPGHLALVAVNEI